LDKYQGEDLETLFLPKWQLFTSSFFPNKPLDKLFAIRDMIQELDPDLLFLVEVGGAESLENFNKYFLNDEYKVYCEPSNSDRGIDTGYMVHKRLPYQVKIKNHVKPVLSSGKKFSRGLLELQLSLDSKIVYINYLLHLKSKLNMKRTDFEGRGQRAAEVEYISNLYSKTSKKFDRVPITISGDFNGVIYKEDTEEEFKDLMETGVQDVFEILNKPIEKRMSYCYFNFQGTRFPMQLDYFMISPSFTDKIGQDSKLIGFQAPYLDTFDLPNSLKEKRDLPSDHHPLLIYLKI
jgi:hypothetical protein